jgi:hypothetical protein
MAIHVIKSRLQFTNCVPAADVRRMSCASWRRLHRQALANYFAIDLTSLIEPVLTGHSL